MAQQPITPENLYPLETLKAALGIGDGWMRSARRAGLRTLRVGGRRFFRGIDVIEFINRPEHEVNEAEDAVEGEVAL